MIDTETILTALIGGSAIGAYLQVAGERRQGRTARAEVLRKLAITEVTRWASDSDDSDAETKFLPAARDLEATALVTGLNQQIVEAYLSWAQVAHNESFKSMVERGDEEGGGGFINSHLSDSVTRLARLLSDSVWHPAQTRISRKRRLRNIESEATKTVPPELLESVKRVAWRRHLAQ